MSEIEAQRLDSYLQRGDNMNVYNVTIETTYFKDIQIEADNPEQAWELAHDWSQSHDALHNADVCVNIEVNDKVTS